MLMPLNFDVSCYKLLEMNDMIRKGSFSFEVNNKLSIFPIPTYIFHYFLHMLEWWEENTITQNQKVISVTGDGLTNMSNVPYTNQTIHK
jgi:hypothetical protein